MRRLLSILLLAAFTLPLLTPLLASGQTGEAGLPACCRREGKHHCMMTMGERNQLVAHDPRFRSPLEHCPYCPAAVAATHHHNWGTPDPAQAIFAALVSHPAGSPQTESRWRIARDRSRQKRGPPAHSLLA